MKFHQRKKTFDLYFIDMLKQIIIKIKKNLNFFLILEIYVSKLEYLIFDFIFLIFFEIQKLFLKLFLKILF